MPLPLISIFVLHLIPCFSFNCILSEGSKSNWRQFSWLKIFNFYRCYKSSKYDYYYFCFVLCRVYSCISYLRFWEMQTSNISIIWSQATQEVVSQLPLTTDEEFKAAISAAKKAFPSWRNTPITTRQRVMLKFQELIRRNMVSNLQHSTTLSHSFTIIETPRPARHAYC